MTRHPTAKNETVNTPSAITREASTSAAPDTKALATVLQAAFGNVVPEQQASMAQVVALDTLRAQTSSTPRDQDSKPTWALDVLCDLQNLAAHSNHKQLETDLQVCISFLSSRMDSYDTVQTAPTVQTADVVPEQTESSADIVSLTHRRNQHSR